MVGTGITIPVVEYCLKGEIAEVEEARVTLMDDISYRSNLS